MDYQKRRSVALLIETSNSYGRGLLDGIISWLRQHETWSVYIPEQERGAPPPNWFAHWDGDGIIARVENQAIAKVLKQTGLPIVNVSAGENLPAVPWVETDDTAIAKMAFEHLAERGFTHFGFCGDPSFRWSDLRKNDFKKLVAQSGFSLEIHDSLPKGQRGYSWRRERQRLIQWVRKLPHPIGILACYDIKGQELLDVCREVDVAVPEEIAVIGVDDSRLICELCEPPLSSVKPNTRRAGYEAAELLDRLMDGESVPAEAHLIPPVGVTPRQSSDILAIDDPDVVTALRFIRDQVFTGITIADVLRHVPVSRRVLESRFRKMLGRTPHEELIRLRMNRAKWLLTETELSLAQIAERSGFEHAEYFSVAFKRQMKITPREFRQQSRGQPLG